MMKRFEDFTGYQIMCDAIGKAEMLLNSASNMMGEIRSKNDFNYNSGSGENVWFKLQSGPLSVKIKLYTPFSPFTRAIAMTNGDGCIYFNSRKIKQRSVEDVVGTILHECAHLCGFTHGNNYKTKEKCLYSVPYWLSENAGRFL